MATTVFPLFRLPNNLIQNVLKTMSIGSLLLLSMCSNSMKSTVKSLNIKAQKISVLLPESMRITINFPKGVEFCFYLAPPNETEVLKQLSDYGIVIKPGKIDVRNIWNEEDGHLIQDMRFTPDKPGMTVRDYLDHFLYVLDLKSIDLTFVHSLYERWGFTEDSYKHPYSLETIKDYLKGLNVKRLRIDEFENFFQIQKVLPNTLKQLDFYSFSRRPNDDLLNKIMIQNFDYLRSGTHSFSTLNHLFLTNSNIIESIDSKLSDKDFNIFIKQWMAGSNSRLQYMHLDYQFVIIRNGMRKFNQDVILEGIKHEKTPGDRERTFNFSTEVGYRDIRKVKFNGGIDIRRRRDGTKATILMDSENFYFKFFVWP